MTFVIEITIIGNAAALLLPDEVLSRLKSKSGDKVCLVETDRGYELIRYDPEFERQMEITEAGMRRFSAALAKLAK